MRAEQSNEVYEAAKDIANNFENEFVNVLGAWHECQRATTAGGYDGDLPEHGVIVAVDCVDGESSSEYGASTPEPYGSAFTYPLTEYARELGLYLFDVVVKVGYEAEERTIYPTPTARGEESGTEVLVELRFGLESDREQ